MLWNEDGTPLAPWAKVIELTKTSGLRPTLPPEIGEAMKRLINDCWHAEAGLRPSVAFIIARFNTIIRDEATNSKRKNSSAKVGAGMILDVAVRSLARDVHQALLQALEEKFQAPPGLIDEDARITSKQKILNEILECEEGSHGLQA